MQKLPKVVRFRGDSGSGKSTLIAAVIKLLMQKGYRVGVIKHSSGFADLDTPGKDTYRFRQAGAQRVMLASSDKSILFYDHGEKEPDLQERLQFFAGFSVVLVESWKAEEMPTIDVSMDKRPDPQEVVEYIERIISSL